MNRKISTLMASLLFASAFVGTADAALVKVTPQIGGSYVIGSLVDEDAGQISYGVASTLSIAANAADVSNMTNAFTLEAVPGETGVFYLKNSTGYLSHKSDAATNYLEMAGSAGTATLKFKFDGNKLVVAEDLEGFKAGNGLSLNPSNNKLGLVYEGCDFTASDLQFGVWNQDITVNGEGLDLVTSIEASQYYIIGSGSAQILKDDGSGSLSTVAETGVTDLATIDNYLWKVTEGKAADGVTPTYKFTNKESGKTIVLGNLDAFTVTGSPANFTLAAAGQGLTATFTSGTAVPMGIYVSPMIAKTADELNAQLGDGFELTIDTEKGKSATIEGIEAFAGKLTAVKVDGFSKVQLKNADGKFVVANTKANWGISQLSDKGLKLQLVSEVKEDHMSYFEFISLTGATSAETLLGFTVSDDKEGTNEYGVGLHMAGGKNYLTASEDYELLVEPYVALGSSSVVEWKDLFNAPAFYNIIRLNPTTLSPMKALSVNTAASDTAWVELSKVQLNQPEGMWAVQYDADADKVTLVNRENGVKKEIAGKLRKTSATAELRAASTVYLDADGRLLVINPVATTSYTDGFVGYDALDLRDEEYTLGFYSNVLGAPAYLAENHVGGHQLGLEADVKSAASWKIAALTGKTDASATTPTYTDSVYVQTINHYYNAAKSKWAKDTTTLKIVAYTITNVSNNEPVYYSTSSDTAAFVCNPKPQATRFVIKKAADGKYNLISLTWNGTSKAWKLDKKVYAGFSAKYGNIQLTNIYDKTENDLVVIEPKAAPEYVKLSAGDTIRIFREGAEASLLFEKGEFLGMENVFEFSKMAPAMFVDTAHIEKNRYEYLLAVEPNRVVTSEECTVPGHPKHETNVLHARFLVNLVDSAYAEAARNIIHGSNKYINSEKFAKLGFVPGYHEGDTLVINNSVFTGTTNAKNDSIQLNSAARNVAKFAFKVVDQDTKAFVIETGYKTYPTAAADEPKVGYLKWMNGAIVVVPEIANADVYNLKATDEDPTANEAIAAEGVQVIGGKGAVTVQGAAGKVITVANILGQTIANQVAASDNVTIAVPAGIVVVAVEGDATKVVVK